MFVHSLSRQVHPRIAAEGRIFKPKGKKGEKSLALFPFIRTFALNQKCFTKGVTPKV
jgi:hypothetical protein